MSRLLIAASGTGGHLFPAVAVAEALPKTWEITWLGVPDRLEVKLVPKKFELITVPVGGLQKNGLMKFVQALKLIAATLSVIRVIRKKRIKVIFTTGGYIAVPAVLAAKLSGIRVVLHESNAFPGKATRLFGRFCDQVALGWPPAAKYLPKCNLVVTGTPVREAFLAFNSVPSWVPVGGGPLIVVLGGSQGAVGLNRMIRDVLPDLLAKGCRVVHITGNKNQSNKVNAKLVEKPFTNEIPGLLQHADLIISRAGAGALSEFAVCNTPVVLVPYPYATDSHQEFNAMYAAEFGGALIVHEHEPGKKALANVLDHLLTSFISQKIDSLNLLDLMKEGMSKMAVRDSHLRIVEILEQIS
ncbi:MULTISPECIES: undecaprenyldiphospho-muramoylpentapeptide beta-N-acetylglucosaminyltransferase [Prochlorococcus]|uniref:undecaprenyldiphospho-muramoylpentapeptide beta-N-acetylglucosaminyltransferase n=1 Tax=Prochlorococcus TaxID=1218 RepID=UPI000533A727|nr:MULTISPECIES: undecaprenyldiphospho-muramoylpentapeptide beta-N-acetylglucosaminyltransferase [Prochlorococcus]KGG13174.1 UDP-N-acetylglucosamine--N-acetylmuramyl- (pentapeptide) pyrophosphoryl-undecaprenol N-acetylglucosamine transferase [Prochlorococcus sp. MIT 0601]